MLQKDVLEILAEMEPSWTLTGGAALVGFHLHHRTTKDLDLFWYGQQILGELPQQVHQRLKNNDLEVSSLQSGRSFHRLHVTRSQEVLVIDLVAEPVPSIEAPQVFSLGKAKIYVDSQYEIIVNKLCTLLSRSELRDLMDLQLLLHQNPNIELTKVLHDASKKDAGFSAIVLAWVLQDFPIKTLAITIGWSDEQIELAIQFRNWLVQNLLILSKPSDYGKDPPS